MEIELIVFEPWLDFNNQDDMFVHQNGVEIPLVK
jgi:hypothetical protein